MHPPKWNCLKPTTRALLTTGSTGHGIDRSHCPHLLSRSCWRVSFNVCVCVCPPREDGCLVRGGRVVVRWHTVAKRAMMWLRRCATQREGARRGWWFVVRVPTPMIRIAPSRSHSNPPTRIAGCLQRFIQGWRLGGRGVAVKGIRGKEKRHTCGHAIRERLGGTAGTSLFRSQRVVGRNNIVVCTSAGATQEAVERGVAQSGAFCRGNRWFA